MSTYDGPLGKATVLAKDEVKATREYDGEITESSATLLTIVCQESRYDGGYVTKVVATYHIPWKRILHIEQVKYV